MPNDRGFGWRFNLSINYRASSLPVARIFSDNGVRHGTATCWLRNRVKDDERSVDRRSRNSRDTTSRWHVSPFRCRFSFFLSYSRKGRTTDPYGKRGRFSIFRSDTSHRNAIGFPRSRETTWPWSLLRCFDSQRVRKAGNERRARALSTSFRLTYVHTHAKSGRRFASCPRGCRDWSHGDVTSGARSFDAASAPRSGHEKTTISKADWRGTEADLTVPVARLLYI